VLDVLDARDAKIPPSFPPLNIVGPFDLRV